MSLEAISYCLPSVKQTSSDIALDTGVDEVFISEKVGLKTRYILGPEETSVSLSLKACEKLLKHNSSIKREEIDLLVCVTQNPDYRIPHNAGLVADGLGLKNQLSSFDLSLGCSGYVYGLQVVEAMLGLPNINHALLVTCDPYSRVMAATNKDTNCVFGDAATASFITARGLRSKILGTDWGTDGSGAESIMIPATGSAKPLGGLLNQLQNNYELDDLHLHMNGRNVFNFVMSRIPESIDNCLKRSGLTKADVDYFVMHQGSVYMLKALARRIGIDMTKVPINMDQFGNTVSSTIPMLLADLDFERKLNSRRILISGFGVGLSWGTMAIEFS